MDKEDNYSGVIDEETPSITGRQSELLDLFLECGSTRVVASLAGVAQKTVARQLNKVAKSRGLTDLRQLLGGVKHAKSNQVRIKRQPDVRPTTNRLMALIEKQEYRCALSGVKLTPDQAALDHKVPVSSGGSDELDNLHWVSNEINRAKGTMDNEAFIAMCKRVAAWQR